MSGPSASLHSRVRVFRISRDRGAYTTISTRPDLHLQEIEEYCGLPDDLVGAAKRWIEWLEFERPEDEPLPGNHFCVSEAGSTCWCPIC